jgi:hypothetical protein
MNDSELIFDKSKLVTPAIDTATLAILVIDHYLMPLMIYSEKRKQLEAIFITKVPRYNCIPILRWLINQLATLETLINETITSIRQHAVQRMRGVFTGADNNQDAGCQSRIHPHGNADGHGLCDH